MNEATSWDGAPGAGVEKKNNSKASFAPFKESGEDVERKGIETTTVRWWGEGGSK